MITRRDDGTYDIPEMVLQGVPESYIPPGALRSVPPVGNTPSAPSDHRSAVRRADGLYDVPGFGYSGLPGHFIPDDLRTSADDAYNQQTLAGAGSPDLRLAYNEGGGSSRGPSMPGESPGNVSDVRPALVANTGGEGGRSSVSNSAGSDSQSSLQQTPLAPPTESRVPWTDGGYSAPANVSNAPKHELNGPQQPTPETSGRTEMDTEWNKYLMNGARGTPSKTTPGGIALTNETWQQQNVAPMPGRSPVITEDPRTGMPVKTMVPNDVLFNAEQSKWREAQGDVENQTESNMRAEGFRERAAGDMLHNAAERERLELEHERQWMEQQRATVAQRDAEIMRTLGDLGRLANDHPVEGPTRSRFVLGIAQGLLLAGAATAGQQVPHINFIKDAIDEDLQRQQLELNTKLHVAGLKLNALHVLRQNLGDPVAAAHALRAAEWTNAQHELEAMAHKGRGAQMNEQAQLMWHQMDEQRANEEKMAFGAAHQKTIENLPPKSVAGTPGGIPGIIAAIKKQYAGAPKETVAAAIDNALSHMQNGQAFVFPGGKPAEMNRAEVSYNKEKSEASIRLPAWLGGHTVYAHSAEEGRKARNAIETTRQGTDLLDQAYEIASSVGGKSLPTKRREVKMIMAKVGGLIRQADKDGVWKASEQDLLKLESGAASLENVTDMTDMKRVVETARSNFRKDALRNVQPGQITKTYEGTDYWEPPGADAVTSD